MHFGSSAAGTVAVAVIGLPLVGATDQTSVVLAAAALVASLGASVALAGWPKAAATAPTASATPLASRLDRRGPAVDSARA